jgi:hypothetical protein
VFPEINYSDTERASLLTSSAASAILTPALSGCKLDVKVVCTIVEDSVLPSSPFIVT